LAPVSSEVDGVAELLFRFAAGAPIGVHEQLPVQAEDFWREERVALLLPQGGQHLQALARIPSPAVCLRDQARAGRVPRGGHDATGADQSLTEGIQAVRAFLCLEPGPGEQDLGVETVPGKPLLGTERYHRLCGLDCGPLVRAKPVDERAVT